ncbi:alpha/beta fold hydrolase [Paraglaciecola polaris]|uniref:Sigma factor sigB regulation protein rsbQ n=1 Tax=Paraglaciecola polaris LMG 21857 TaxID=1129793 RepID=K6ZXD6_9ALTE|nr:alpha/beta hydrolase [Paraglaciecola polaris]GAC34882.1 sigma factor sigB regulation protein rsbQ [Paraglaciecola polaris LMG 21857]
MLNESEVMRRNNVTVIESAAGPKVKTLLLAHGFGCDQNMWRFVAPALTQHFRLVLFDYVGSGRSDISAFSMQRYANLEGYAQDVLDICEALSLTNVTLVGHSVSSMISLLAADKQPDYFERIVMICPSPCFLNIDATYQGGFERDDLDELLNLMDKNYMGWANYLTPLVMGTGNDNALLSELNSSFCSTDPVIAKTFAKATFYSDYRHILPLVGCPVLVLQSENDALASEQVGQYVAQHIPQASYLCVPAKGHCLHMTDPDTVVESIEAFLNVACHHV